MHLFLQLTVLAIWCCLTPVAHAEAGSEATQPNAVFIPPQQPGGTASPAILSSTETTCGQNILRDYYEVLLDGAHSQEFFPCSGRFQLFEEGTKKPLKGYLYAITSDGKVIWEGHADEQGRTRLFLSNKETTLHLQNDAAVFRIIEQRYPPPRTRFADTFDHIGPELVLLFLILLGYSVSQMLAARRQADLPCSLCTLKNIRWLLARGFAVLLAAYGVYFFVLPLEYAVSPPGVVYFYYPQWACGQDCPPYVVIDTDNTALQPNLGKEARVFERTIDEYHTEEYSRFFKCHGQFKKSVGLYVWEWASDEIDRKDVTGSFFDAEWCSYAEASPRQSDMTTTFVGRMMGIEPEDMETEN